MPSKLNDTFLSAKDYNNLPTIGEVGNAPSKHDQDLEYLRSLLSKHDVAKGVSIRLIHKHYDTKEGEVMVFSKIPVPDYKDAIIMKPVMVGSGSSKGLNGIHFLVDENGMLQAYEYGNFVVPDMAKHQAFLAEFCSVVSQRGLERVFGLKLQDEEDEVYRTSYREYELPEQRGTIMFPKGMPMPEDKTGLTVSTEWRNPAPSTPAPYLDCIGHCNSHCPSHCVHFDRDETCESPENGHTGHIYLGNQCLLPGTEVHQIVQQIITVF